MENTQKLGYVVSRSRCLFPSSISDQFVKMYKEVHGGKKLLKKYEIWKDKQTLQH